MSALMVGILVFVWFNNGAGDSALFNMLAN
jgi:hypothetical protein